MSSSNTIETLSVSATKNCGQTPKTLLPPAISSRAETTLAACFNGGRLSHAILVEGMSGTLDFAKKIAKGVVCGSEKDKPCGLCRDCAKADKGIHPDIIVYSREEKQRSFKVEAVREIRGEAYVRPNEAGAKALILEDVQNMTTQAQNALLKIIEEPPGDVVFILTCENKAVLLETILSRVTVFSLDDSILPEPDDESSGFSEKAKGIVENLVSGSELDALAAISAYEKDRAGLTELFSAIRREAASGLITAAKTGQNNRDRNAKLSKIVEVVNEIEAGLNQNVGGLLMTAILPAMLKQF